MFSHEAVLRARSQIQAVEYTFGGARRVTGLLLGWARATLNEGFVVSCTSYVMPKMAASASWTRSELQKKAFVMS